VEARLFSRATREGAMKEIRCGNTMQNVLQTIAAAERHIEMRKNFLPRVVFP
jgi:hypothetical protein